MTGSRDGVTKKEWGGKKDSFPITPSASEMFYEATVQTDKEESRNVCEYVWISFEFISMNCP